MSSIYRFVVNIAPGMSIPELQEFIKEMGVDAIVVNDRSVQKSDVPLLEQVLSKGTSIIVFLKMRKGKGSATTPDGHFIALIPTKKGLEIFDPAGDDARYYLDNFGEWIRLLAENYRITWAKSETQPKGSNSCGPWSVIRAGQKDMPLEKFLQLASGKHMINRLDTIKAFGPVGRERPHMSSLRAQNYGDFLREGLNVNDAAAKHLAHVLNRDITNDPAIAEKPMHEVLSLVKDALPELEVEAPFLEKYGGARAEDFNAYVKQLKKSRPIKSVAEQALAGAAPRAVPRARAAPRAGAPKAGATKAGVPKAGAPKAVALKAGAPKAGALKVRALKARAGAPLAGSSLGGALLGGALLGGVRHGRMGGYCCGYDHEEEVEEEEDCGGAMKPRAQGVRRTTLLTAMR